MKGIPAAFAISALAACSTTPMVAVPENLKPAENESLAVIAAAKGVQIYECRAGAWAFVAPDAELFDASGKKIGRHYAGPSWEAADGSKVLGTVKARADAPAPNAIPWLLLGAKSIGPEGTFSKVTSVQRIATAGGVAPAGGCAEAGARARVAYTADYYFYSRRGEPYSAYGVRGGY